MERKLSGHQLLLLLLLILSLERFRTEIAQRRVTALTVVPDFDPLKTARLACSRVSKRVR